MMMRVLILFISARVWGTSPGLFGPNIGSILLFSKSLIRLYNSNTLIFLPLPTLNASPKQSLLSVDIAKIFA
jgi:hypothetical protein